MIRRTFLLTSFALASLLVAGTATTAHAQARTQARRFGPLKAALSAKDKARLQRTAARHRSEIGPFTLSDGKTTGFTPVVDLHIAEASSTAGIRWKKTNDSYLNKGPTTFEIEGIDKAGGELHLVLTGSASGHVMNPTYGGRPFSVVEDYGKNDMVYLSHRRPGKSATERVVSIKSRGLVTQEGFTVSGLEKGEHNFFYFRSGTSEGSEPELRQVKIIVK